MDKPRRQRRRTWEVAYFRTCLIVRSPSYSRAPQAANVLTLHRAGGGAGRPVEARVGTPRRDVIAYNIDIVLFRTTSQTIAKRIGSRPPDSQPIIVVNQWIPHLDPVGVGSVRDLPIIYMAPKAATTPRSITNAITIPSAGITSFTRERRMPRLAPFIFFSSSRI